MRPGNCFYAIPSKGLCPGNYFYAIPSKGLRPGNCFYSFLSKGMCPGRFFCSFFVFSLIIVYVCNIYQRINSQSVLI